MEYRLVTLSNGKTVKVMRRIQRIDSKSTHGWQVRHKGTKFFSDGDEGYKVSLKNAEAELVERIRTESGEFTRIRQTQQKNKKTDLPVGITGPQLRVRKGRFFYAQFQVLLPVYGKANRHTSVYIASERTWTQKHYDKALAKAIKIRDEAAEEYRRKEAQASVNQLFNHRSKVKVDPVKFKNLTKSSILYTG